MLSRMDRSVVHKLLPRFKEKVSNVKDEYVRKLSSRKKAAVANYRYRKRRFYAWYSSQGAEYIEYLKFYTAYFFIYGLLLNYALYVLLTFPLPSINFYTVTAYGIVYYFVKEEFTEILSMIIGKVKGREQ